MTTPKKLVLSHINQRWHISALHTAGSVTAVGFFDTEGQARAHVDGIYPGVRVELGGSSWYRARVSQ